MCACVAPSNAADVHKNTTVAIVVDCPCITVVAIVVDCPCITVAIVVDCPCITVAIVAHYPCITVAIVVDCPCITVAIVADYPCISPPSVAPSFPLPSEPQSQASTQCGQCLPALPLTALQEHTLSFSASGSSACDNRTGRQPGHRLWDGALGAG